MNTHTITRYKNRRLYSQTLNRYVNFQDLTELLKTKVPFKVTCAVTRNDITRQVMKDLVVGGYVMGERFDALVEAYARTEG